MSEFEPAIIGGGLAAVRAIKAYRAAWEERTSARFPSDSVLRILSADADLGRRRDRRSRPSDLPHLKGHEVIGLTARESWEAGGAGRVALISADSTIP